MGDRAIKPWDSEAESRHPEPGARTASTSCQRGKRAVHHYRREGACHLKRAHRQIALPHRLLTHQRRRRSRRHVSGGCLDPQPRSIAKTKCMCHVQQPIRAENLPSQVERHGTSRSERGCDCALGALRELLHAAQSLTIHRHRMSQTLRRLIGNQAPRLHPPREHKGRDRRSWLIHALRGAVQKG